MGAVVCGIDPGLGTTGYAILRSDGQIPSVVDAGVCRLDEKSPLSARLAALHRDLLSILTEHKPDVVAVEELYAHYAHPRTAILMGHARGVILCAAAQRDIPLQGFAATHIKRFLTGNGRASKNQMQRAIQATLGLESLPDPPDVADALAIALCAVNELSHNSAMEIPV